MDFSSKQRWSITKLATYQILPGVVSLAIFIPALLLVRDTGLPRMAALFIAILLGETPMSWYLMIRTLREEGKTLSVESLFPWRAKIGKAKIFLLGLPLAIVSMMIVFGLSMAFETPIREAFFSWVPEWMVLVAGPEGMAGSSQLGLILLWILSGAVGVLIGGFTQELYARGFLLPRAAHLGWKAVPLNALFFAMLHVAAPWGWPFFFLASLIWGAVVYKWKSVQLGLAGHIGMLAIGWLMMTLVVFGLVPPMSP